VYTNFREKVPFDDNTLLQYTVEDIAKELTLIDRGYLIQLNYNDLLTSVTRAPWNAVSVSEILHFIKFYNNPPQFFFAFMSITGT